MNERKDVCFRFSNILHEDKRKKTYISTGVIQCKLTYLLLGCTSTEGCANAQNFFRILSLWDMALFHRLINSRRFETITWTRKVKNELPIEKASYPRRRQSAATSLQNSQDLNSSEFKMKNAKCMLAFDWIVAALGYNLGQELTGL